MFVKKLLKNHWTRNANITLKLVYTVRIRNCKNHNPRTKTVVPGQVQSLSDMTVYSKESLGCFIGGIDDVKTTDM